MKKLFVPLTVFLLLFVLVGCGNADISPNEDAEVPYVYDSMMAESNNATQEEEQAEQNAEAVLLTGAIVIRDNWLYVDLVEIFMHDDEGMILPFLSDLALDGVEVLTANDHERVAEVGLNFDLFQNWHYIRHNVGDEPLRFEITNETVFTFTDTDLRFIIDDPVGNPRRQANVGVDEFIQYIDDSFWSAPIPPVLDPDSIGTDTLLRRPYFVKVQDGRVIIVLEEFLFTQ